LGTAAAAARPATPAAAGRPGRAAQLRSAANRRLAAPHLRVPRAGAHRCPWAAGAAAGV